MISVKKKYGKFVIFITYGRVTLEKVPLSHDVVSESEITPCNKICKPLVVYRFSGNVMTSITT